MVDESCFITTLSTLLDSFSKSASSHVALYFILPLFMLLSRRRKSLTHFHMNYGTDISRITHFAPEISRFKPNLVWYIFIPADVICLVLQAAGGAMSSISSGSSQKGIDIAMAGLALQVAVLFFFCVVFGDYMIRYFRLRSDATLSRRMRFYFGFLATAVVLILGRCCYRCYELSEGYQDSKLITDEGLFIGLEGV